MSVLLRFISYPHGQKNPQSLPFSVRKVYQTDIKPGLLDEGPSQEQRKTITRVTANGQVIYPFATIGRGVTPQEEETAVLDLNKHAKQLAKQHKGKWDSSHIYEYMVDKYSNVVEHGVPFKPLNAKYFEKKRGLAETMKCTPDVVKETEELCSQDMFEDSLAIDGDVEKEIAEEKEIVQSASSGEDSVKSLVLIAKPTASMSKKRSLSRSESSNSQKSKKESSEASASDEEGETRAEKRKMWGMRVTQALHDMNKAEEAKKKEESDRKDSNETEGNGMLGTQEEQGNGQFQDSEKRTMTDITSRRERGEPSKKDFDPFEEPKVYKVQTGDPFWSNFFSTSTARFPSKLSGKYNAPRPCQTQGSLQMRASQHEPRRRGPQKTVTPHFLGNSIGPQSGFAVSSRIEVPPIEEVKSILDHKEEAPKKRPMKHVGLSYQDYQQPYQDPMPPKIETWVTHTAPLWMNTVGADVKNLHSKVNTLTRFLADQKAVSDSNATARDVHLGRDLSAITFMYRFLPLTSIQAVLAFFEQIDLVDTLSMAMQERFSSNVMTFPFEVLNCVLSLEFRAKHRFMGKYIKHTADFASPMPSLFTQWFIHLSCRIVGVPRTSDIPSYLTKCNQHMHGATEEVTLNGKTGVKPSVDVVAHLKKYRVEYGEAFRAMVAKDAAGYEKDSKLDALYNPPYQHKWGLARHVYSDSRVHKALTFSESEEEDYEDKAERRKQQRKCSGTSKSSKNN